MASITRFDAEYYSYADECNNRNAGYAPTWSLATGPWIEPLVCEADCPVAPVPPPALQACGNPMCARQSEALYCSPYCFEAIEGVEEELEDAMPEVPTPPALTQEQLDAAVTYLREHATPAERRYIALRLGDPEGFYVDATGEVLLGEKSLIAQQRQIDDARGLAWLACSRKN